MQGDLDYNQVLAMVEMGQNHNIPQYLLGIEQDVVEEVDFMEVVVQVLKMHLVLVVLGILTHHC